MKSKRREGRPLKKETHFGKLANFPDKSPGAGHTPPKEARATNNIPKDNQTDTQQKAGFTGELAIRIPKSLHSQLNSQAGDEGVSLTEYIIYKLSR